MSTHRKSLFVLSCATLLITACASPARLAPHPSSAGSVAAGADARIDALARVLRAEDRRRVDDDLLAALGDSDSAVRAAAVRALGRIGDPVHGERIIAALDDASDEVRAEAAYAAVTAGLPDAASIVAARIEDESATVRRVLAHALGCAQRQDAARALVRLAEDPDPGVRSSALIAATRLPDPSPILEPAIALLRTSDPLTQFASAYALARLASPAGSQGAAFGQARADAISRGGARDALTGLAEHPNPNVRMQVARGLSPPIGQGEFATLQALAGDRDLRVRIAALRALAVRGAPIDRRIRATLQSRQNALVWAALESLGRIGGPEASEELVERIVGIDHPWLKEAAIRAINLADPALAAQIANGLSNEPLARHRAATAPSLAGAHTDRTHEITLKLLRDEEPLVQAAAVPAALSHGLVEDAEIAEEILASPHPVVRAALAREIRNELTGIERSAADVDAGYGLLARLWEGAAADPSALVRLSVLAALPEGSERDEANRILQRALEDPDERVRRKAARAIVAATGVRPQTSPASARSLEEYRAIARWASRPRAAIVTIQRAGFAPGRFTLRLDTIAAPLTCWQFFTLASEGFYDGMTVDRLTPNFAVQFGDERADGTKTMLPAARPEPAPNYFGTGTVAMLGLGAEEPDNLFFVTLAAQPHLEGRYTAFAGVAQSFAGVVALLEPGDRIVSIEFYEGDGSEPLPER